ncbi:MAG: TerD family protein [Sphingomonas fennica]
MTDLTQGANAPAPDGALAITLRWPTPAGRPVEADASAYCLGPDGRVRGDHDMIFYNQPDGAGGAVRYAQVGGGARFDVMPDRLPAGIERIVFCLTIHEAQARGQTMALLDGAAIEVAGGGGTLRYQPVLAGAGEAALILAELYRRQGAWKLRTVGQGFTGGLAPLARSFGIDVAEDVAPPAPPAPPPAPPVRLSKVTLEKPGQTVSLTKAGGDFGEIVVNLNWSRGRRGFFGGGDAVDLDLGCLYELADGDRGVVQALGDAFGDLAGPPHIALSGDDRTGDVAAGETLRVNGARWSAIRRIMLFANIYDGAPNWRQTDGVVTVTMPGQPPIEVRLTEGNDRRRLCGVVLIENDGGRLKATRIVEYFADQRALDRRFGWGLRWVHGSKD